jgi:tRNA dimethylallyltransferase
VNVPRIVFIVGPTAVGKSAIAIEVARRTKGEIISCDSMQVYKNVPIVTNQPSARDLKSVRHHLIGVLPVSREFDVVQYRQIALKAIADIHKRKRVPIVVGGSGMYVQVLLDGIFDGPARNESLRQHLNDLAQGQGVDYLYKSLCQKDPARAQKIHPNDLRRIIRALEVIETQRQPMSQLQKNRDGLWGKWDVQYFGLNCDRQELYRKIDQRVDEMFGAGLEAEIKKLKKITLSSTASRIIGVREVREYLQGACDWDRAKYLIKRNTRHYAKRQLTWFRKDKRIQWINLNERVSVKDAATLIIQGTGYAQ